MIHWFRSVFRYSFCRFIVHFCSSSGVFRAICRRANTRLRLGTQRITIRDCVVMNTWRPITWCVSGRRDSFWNLFLVCNRYLQLTLLGRRQSCRWDVCAYHADVPAWLHCVELYNGTSTHCYCALVYNISDITKLKHLPGCSIASWGTSFVRCAFLGYCVLFWSSHWTQHTMNLTMVVITGLWFAFSMRCVLTFSCGFPFVSF